MVTLPASTTNVGEQLSSQLASQRQNNRHCLHEIMMAVKFLSRQGLAFRGDKDESDSNIIQLLKMKAECDPLLEEWLKRKENVYVSATIQNEMIKTMGLSILRDIASTLQSAPFLTIMADETTDASNKEQVTIFLRWVTESLLVHEEFLGLYFVDSIDAKTITFVITDLFQRFNLDMRRVRGQCYDGASSMSGSRSGVAKRITEIEPRALFTHCYGHALNLAACDVLKQSKVMKNALELTHEITKLIKYSPRREGIFLKVKEGITTTSCPGIRVLCPTRWTVRAESLSSIMSNFEVLRSTWEEAVDAVQDTETKSRIRGVASQMETFEYFFGNLLGTLILKHADNLSSTLQHESVSAAEGQQIAKMTVQTLQSIRNDESFENFWKCTTEKAKQLDIGEPKLPRQRKRTRRYDDGNYSGYFHDTSEALFKQMYFEALDLIINCIQDRFDQPGFRIYQSVESLLVKACQQKDWKSDLDIVCEMYKDDFNKDLLSTQLNILEANFKDYDSSDNITIFDVKNYLLSRSPGQLALISQVKRLIQLLLVMPATNASSERSFSALRRVKNYLRTTMTQERLNYLMILYVHKERTDSLDMKSIINEFISSSEHRNGIFANDYNTTWYIMDG